MQHDIELHDLMRVLFFYKCIILIKKLIYFSYTFSSLVASFLKLHGNSILKLLFTLIQFVFMLFLPYLKLHLIEYFKIHN